MDQIDFSSLINELDIWSVDSFSATFWWRDDDAAAPCEALDHLLDIACGTPLALATVPFYATTGLTDRLVQEPNVSIFQHGWKHKNQAGEGANSEYPAGRPLAEVAEEFGKGFEKLFELFGCRFVPVFTPPWHGLDDAYLPLLREAGLVGLSTKGQRSAEVIGGLAVNNIHCVPIEWSDPPGFDDPALYIGQLVSHLKQRRVGNDRHEPTGILTHHLVQTRESLEFVRAVLNVISSHPNAQLLDPADLFCCRHEGLSAVDVSTALRSPNSPSTIV